MPLLDDRTQQLTNVLADSVAKCEACAKDCASQGNADLAGCINLCLDCATLCQACIPLLARGSEFSPPRSVGTAPTPANGAPWSASGPG